MPFVKKARKETKEEKQALLLEDQLKKLSSNDEQVEDEQEAALWFMQMSIPRDIKYRRSNNLPDLLPTKELDSILVALNSDDKSVWKKAIDQYAFLYNVKLISSMKSKELEIRDGKKCRSCGKMTASMRNVQLRAGDEGTGRVLQCTNPKCKAVRKLDSG